MDTGGKILEALFEDVLGPIVNWAVALILFAVAAVAAGLWLAVFVF